MKTLTVWQPWSSLIMLGAKPFEFRNWDYRTRAPGLVGQRIVIHAGARRVHPQEIMDLLARIAAKESSLNDEIALPLLRRISAAHKCQGVVELSAGMGTAVLGKPRPVGELFGGKGHDSDRLNHHRWAWPLTDIQPFKPPVPMKGMQGFWEWPEKIAA